MEIHCIKRVFAHGDTLYQPCTHSQAQAAFFSNPLPKTVGEPRSAAKFSVQASQTTQQSVHGQKCKSPQTLDFDISGHY